MKRGLKEAKADALRRAIDNLFPDEKGTESLYQLRLHRDFGIQVTTYSPMKRGLKDATAYSTLQPDEKGTESRNPLPNQNPRRLQPIPR